MKLRRGRVEALQNRVLVTGCLGFSGHAMVQFLLSRGYHVVGLDISDSKPRLAFEMLVVDLRSMDDVSHAVAEVAPSHVVHLAAITDREHVDPLCLMDVNVCGTLNLLEAIAQHVPRARVCVVGSSAEYGRVDQSDSPIGESEPPRPLSAYGISKVAQSLAAQRAWLKHGLHVVRTRTFNLIGPGLPDALAPGSFARQVAEAEAGCREPEISTGRLTDYRDFVDIRDAVRAYWLCLEQGAPGAVYNVCSGQAVQIVEILNMLLDATSCELAVRTDDDPLVASAVPFQVGSFQRLATQTGWQPGVPLAQSVCDLLSWWREKIDEQRSWQRFS